MKFQETFCSQCGETFGPGDSGFSHCDQHENRMLPEVAESIRIADKHLAGEPPERRKALALDINAAIVRHAGSLMAVAINEAVAKARQRH